MLSPFHELTLKFKRTAAAFHLWSSNRSDSSTPDDSELKLLEETGVSEHHSLEHSLDAEQRNSPSRLRLLLCITINVVSTVSIVRNPEERKVISPTNSLKVFTNKYIFSNEVLRNCQLAFASYHFFITGLTLWVILRQCCSGFVAKPISIYRKFHLVFLTCAQVVLQNLSLAYSSVIFHQLVRLLLTPATALLSFLLYRTTIPRASIIPLMLLCGGVGIVFYFDSVSTTNRSVGTSLEGIIFAFSGVLASALYTALVGSYQKKLQVGSMQLLLNQAPVSAGLLLCMAPFIDTPPTHAALSPSLCIAILAVSYLSFTGKVFDE